MAWTAKYEKLQQSKLSEVISRIKRAKLEEMKSSEKLTLNLVRKSLESHYRTSLESRLPKLHWR